MGTSLRDKKRELIAKAFVDAAEGAFGDEGYERTTMSAIAKRAGCAAGTIYLYFESKEQLFNAMVARHAAAVGERIRAVLEEAEDPREGLRATMFTVARYHAEHPVFFRVFYTAEPGPRPNLKESLREEALTKYLESKQLEIVAAKRAQKLGLIRGDVSAEELIDFMHAACLSAFSRWATAKKVPTPEQQAELLWKLVSGGLLGDAPRTGRKRS
jgi:AcrR family transcriptional regulator